MEVKQIDMKYTDKQSDSDTQTKEQTRYRIHKDSQVYILIFLVHQVSGLHTFTSYNVKLKH